MKNKNKGFTLIELLVVVAIIGILAAVGTVAYTGYTGAAKKNASKSIHASMVKYISAELAKCNMDTTSTVFDGGDGTIAVTCASTATVIASALVSANSKLQDRNPYNSAAAAVIAGTTATGCATEGATCLFVAADSATINIDTNWNGTVADNLNNKVEVE